MAAAPPTNIKADLRLNKKTFNAVAAAFFKEIGKIFPSDPKMLFLSQELQRLSKKPHKDHIPAMQFFKAMNVPTGLPSLTDGSAAVVGELVLTHDERLFAPNCNATIPQLDAVDFKNKWAMLSTANRQFVWGYLERMAALSAKVATALTIDAGDIMELVHAVTQASQASPETDEQERIAAMMGHPAVSSVAQAITEKMETLCSQESKK